jgi:hypothetical protein
LGDLKTQRLEDGQPLSRHGVMGITGHFAGNVSAGRPPSPLARSFNPNQLRGRNGQCL